MRTLTVITVAALALTACNPMKNSTTANTIDVGEAMTVPPNDSSNGNTAKNETVAVHLTTSEYVTKAAMGDMFEIAASKLALTNAASPGIKKFAQSMIDGHMVTTNGLKAAIAKGQVKASLPAMLDVEHKSLLEGLIKAKGAAFDTLYKKQQADAHVQALAVHRGYAESGDDTALKAFASETAPKVQMHLDMLNAM